MFKTTYSSLYYLLVNIIWFFAFFDGIRSNMLHSEYITLVKAIVTFGTFFFVLLYYKKGLKLNWGIKLFYIDVLIVFLVSLCDAIQLNIYYGIRFYAQYFLFILFVYLYQPLVHSEKFNINQILTSVTKISVLYVLMNWFFFFIELPIWTRFHPWWGRISQGYPTLEVFPLSISLAILLLYEKLLYSRNLRLLYILIVTAGLLGMVSGTGFVSLGLISITVFMVLSYKKKPSIIIKQTFISLAIIGILIFSGITAIRHYSPALYENIIYVGNNRLSILLGGGEDVEFNTFDIRKKQYEAAQKKYIKDEIDYLVGIGTAKVTCDALLVNEKNIFIEDQYSLNFITMGVLGNVLMAIFLLSLIIHTLKRNDITMKTKAMYLLFVLLFGVCCKNSCPFNSFAALAVFSLCYVLIMGDLSLPGKTDSSK